MRQGMGLETNLFITLLLLGLAMRSTNAINRGDFPQGFTFGAGSSAFQVEGAAGPEYGRGPSIWDTFTHKYPDKIIDHSNGDVAIDQYHRYKEDVGLMKELGMDSYRFSISWSRVLPNGTQSGGVNENGANYYDNLINELLDNGIEPFVTIFHWDLPQALEDEYGGFLSSKIVEDFKDYAEFCFKRYGDRVKHWTTLNEPWVYSVDGYALGLLPPGRCSNWLRLINSTLFNCTGGDSRTSGTEPYNVTHNQLLAHAATVKVYKEKYQATQRGFIGIVFPSLWLVPFSNSTEDIEAVQRGLDFMLGWTMNPVIYGDYPNSMRSRVKERLPEFSANESEMVKGSFDFIGLNYYTAAYAANTPSYQFFITYMTDAQVNLTSLCTEEESERIRLGPQGIIPAFCIYPRGIKELVSYVKTQYNDPPIYITENGVYELNNDSKPLEEALNDTTRVYYHDSHLSFLLEAIKDGANVKGYFAWSFLDTFEWASGYTERFGLNYVDYKNGLTRYQKLSFNWFKEFLEVPNIESYSSGDQIHSS